MIIFNTSMRSKLFKKQIKEEEEDNAPHIEKIYPMTIKEDLKIEITK